MADASLQPAPGVSGIYEIVNLVNGKRYVGSAANFRKRWGGHRAQLMGGRHHNRHLQSSWRLHGPEAFEFRPLLVCSKENLLLYEQIAIDALAPEFNVERVAGSSIGCIRTPETRDKIAAKAVGRQWTEEARAKLSATLTGRKMSDEFCAKLRGNKYAAGTVFDESRRAAISKFMTGQKRPKSDEHRSKIAAALTGRSLSSETKAKISAANTGKKRGSYAPWSEEAKTRFREVMASKPNPMLGKRHSEVTRAKISAALIGKSTATEERRREMSERCRAMWDDPLQRAAILEARRKSRAEKGPRKAYSEQAMKNLAAAAEARRGKKMSDETRARMSASHKAKGLSESQKEAMRLGRKRQAAEKAGRTLEWNQEELFSDE